MLFTSWIFGDGPSLSRRDAKHRGVLINDPSDSTTPTRPDAADLPELSDAALIDRIATLTALARESTAELISHLVELERRNLHLACGFSSIFFYCRDVLRFSEPESYQRMQAAHV